jgi:chromosome segregation ATPase
MVPPQFRNRDPRYPPPPPNQQKQKQPPLPPPRPPQQEGEETKEEGQDNQITGNEEADDVVEITTEQQEGEQKREDPEQNPLPRRPPPPALPQWTDSTSAGQEWNSYSAQSYDDQQQQQQQQQQYYQNQWQDPGGMVRPPPPQHYYDYDQHPQHGDTYSYLEEELNESLVRESSLITQLDNLTSAVVLMEQREELHMRQLDVLTERVIDVEAKAAEDRNLLFEYEANCTALGATILGLQEELDEWQTRCKDLVQRHDDDQIKLKELQDAIKGKQTQAEELAIAMEQLRMVQKRREVDHYSGRSSNKKGGLFSWVFGMFGFGGSDDRYDDEIAEESYEMAKSTLLRALQSERANVHELETAVASLQQNNSAISDMVESRDSIINELNNRIAVFEEDKVVLKAALRQLQKEMKEEAPKTQKLVEDLAAAEEEINRLKQEIHSIIGTHQDEFAALQATISQKQKKITDAESNLTAIGTYVDKLEERLTSFAVTRRDMEERENKCKEIEKAAEETEVQRKALQTQVEEYKKEQDDLKKLLEELATERTNLQKENRKLYTEREFRIGEQEQLEVRCKALEADKKSTEEELQEWKDKCENLVPELEISKESKVKLEEQVKILEETQERLQALQEQNKDLIEKYEKIQAELSEVVEEKSQLQLTVTNMTQLIAEKEEAGKKASEVVNNTKHDDDDDHNTSTKEDDEESRSTQPPTYRPKIPATFSKIPERKVPLRTLRKKLSKLTGLHGLITPKSAGASPSTRTPLPRTPLTKQQQQQQVPIGGSPPSSEEKLREQVRLPPPPPPLP